MNALGQISVYVVLASGKMIEVWQDDEWTSGSFAPEDAVEMCAQRIHGGQVVRGRLIGEEGPEETFRFFAIEPRSVELMFANA